MMKQIKNLLSAYVGTVRLGREVGQGVFIKRIGRDLFLYTKAGRSIEVYAEMMGAGPISYIIYPSSVQKWLAPHQQDPLAEFERQEIVVALGRYFEMSGKKYRTQW